MPGDAIRRRALGTGPVAEPAISRGTPPAPPGQAAAATLRMVVRPVFAAYPADMDLTAFILMASAFTFSGFVVLLGWR